jgi:hypothetical protein
MRLSALLRELSEIDVEIIDSWHQDGKRGITLGSNKRDSQLIEYQYPISIYASTDPELTDEEVRAIRRCFGIYET